MVGMGSVKHLELLVNGLDDHNDPTEYQTLIEDDGTFRKRDDVFIRYGDRMGPLTVGYGAKEDKLGPELGAGWVLGDLLEDDIVLIKSAYGGRTLGIDFRPPASGEGNYSGIKPSHYGWEYRQMIQDFTDALKHLNFIYPAYNATKGYQLSGFCWFQGWNDMLNWDTVNEYEFNLVNLIRDLRRELDAPDLPMVIGELGMHGPHPSGKGSDRVYAMRAAEKSVTVMPEFRDTSRFVATSSYMVMNGTTYNGGYHYNGRADTYYHIGKAFGRALFQLLPTVTPFTSYQLHPNPMHIGQWEVDDDAFANGRDPFLIEDKQQ